MSDQINGEGEALDLSVIGGNRKSSRLSAFRARSGSVPVSEGPKKKKKSSAADALFSGGAVCDVQAIEDGAFEWASDLVRAPAKVVRVDLRHKNLCVVSRREMVMFQSLVFLDVSDNELAFEDFVGLPVLEELKMTCNGIVDIPKLEGQTRFTHLATLDLSFNSLTTEAVERLPDYAPNLVSLDVSFNGIRKFPSFRDFVRLRNLNAAHNALSGASVVQVGRAPLLQHVTLDSNRVSALPESFDPNTFLALESVSLAHNDLTNIAQVRPLLRLPKLGQLSLWGNTVRPSAVRAECATVAPAMTLFTDAPIPERGNIVSYAQHGRKMQVLAARVVSAPRISARDRSSGAKLVQSEPSTPSSSSSRRRPSLTEPKVRSPHQITPANSQDRISVATGPEVAVVETEDTFFLTGGLDFDESVFVEDDEEEDEDRGIIIEREFEEEDDPYAIFYVEDADDMEREPLVVPNNIQATAKALRMALRTTNRRLASFDSLPVRAKQRLAKSRRARLEKFKSETERTMPPPEPTPVKLLAEARDNKAKLQVPFSIRNERQAVLSHWVEGLGVGAGVHVSMKE